MKIAVASGKGGTGKTIIATSLALVWENPTFLDCDVEGPNAHLLLHPTIEESRPVTVTVPRVNEIDCNLCGECADFCRSNALAVLPRKWMVFEQLCHSCGGCRLVCPTGAIYEENRRIGEVRFGRRDHIPFVQGELDEGEAHPIPIIEEVLRHSGDQGDVILDSPPGTSCSMIEVAEAADVVLLVTEPTPFGLHDLNLAVRALKEIRRPAAILVNRADWGADEVRDFARSEDIPILLEIPHILKVAEGYARSRPLVESAPEFRSAFALLKSQLRSLTRETAA
ncbi:MAG: ATP-binding protein [Thermoanaerobaculales bacterium]|nr:ATP-binding protein [Thermoanaerobaculales bacterium]